MAPKAKLTVTRAELTALVRRHTNAEIADMFDVGVTAVSNRRKKYGISEQNRAGEYTVAECEGCAKVKGRRCAVIEEPAAWQPGCTARTDDAEWEQKVKVAVAVYSAGR